MHKGKGKQAQVYLGKKGRGSRPGFIEGAVTNLELLMEEVTDLDAVVGEVSLLASVPVFHPPTTQTPFLCSGFSCPRKASTSCTLTF